MFNTIKLLARTLFLAIPFVLVACSPAAERPSTSSPPSASKPIKVGLVSDVGKVDDKSFNQSAWEGVQRTQKELGAEIKVIETSDAKDYGKNIDLFAQDNYDVIVTVGFAIGQATQAAAQKYPKVKFIGVDQFQEKPIENVAGLIFPEDKAGYLAGALAAMVAKTDSIGQVLGTPVVPPVEAFGVGYIKGAKDVKNIRVLSACHPGGLAKGFTDPDWGKAAAVQMMDQGAGVIFAAGGNTGNGALLAIVERQNLGVLGIGVDADQYFTLSQARPILLSSAMKLITPGVFDLVKDAKEGKFKGGNNVGEVSLAPFHDLDTKVTKEVRTKIQQLTDDLKAGKIDTSWSKPTGNCPATR